MLHRSKKYRDILKVASVVGGEIANLKACHFPLFHFQLCHQRSLLKCHCTFYIYGLLPILTTGAACTAMEGYCKEWKTKACSTERFTKVHCVGWSTERYVSCSTGILFNSLFNMPNRDVLGSSYAFNISISFCAMIILLKIHLLLLLDISSTKYSSRQEMSGVAFLKACSKSV